MGRGTPMTNTPEIDWLARARELVQEGIDCYQAGYLRAALYCAFDGVSMFFEKELRCGLSASGRFRYPLAVNTTPNLPPILAPALLALGKTRNTMAHAYRSPDENSALRFLVAAAMCFEAFGLATKALQSFLAKATLREDEHGHYLWLAYGETTVRLQRRTDSRLMFSCLLPSWPTSEQADSLSVSGADGTVSIMAFKTDARSHNTALPDRLSAYIRRTSLVPVNAPVTRFLDSRECLMQTYDSSTRGPDRLVLICTPALNGTYYVISVRARRLLFWPLAVPLVTEITDSFRFLESRSQ